ncbi:MAG: N-6 DNA methylase [Nitrososphaerales archaeon]
MFRYRSERDFVANYVLPRLKEAAERLGVAGVVDFHVEPSIDGRPDLTAERGGRGIFVLEAKFRKKVGRVERDIEPRDPDVINQAVGYAALGGFPYYLTCNARRIVLFQLRAGVKAYESEVASYDYDVHPSWAEDVLKATLGLVPVRLKPLDDTLVDMLHEAFNDLYPEFLSSLKERLKDKAFYDRYVSWLESQGVEFGDESNRLVAAQSTYLQINKLLFYQVIRAIYPDRLSQLRVFEDEDVSDALGRFYAEARKIDYAPIYESDIISEIPLTARAGERIRTLIDSLNEFDFSKMESDFLGRVYEKLIPPLERKRLGQFYTPPSIVDLIIRLTLRRPDAVVLDPACGSGSFLVKAYHRLRELNGIPRDASGAFGELFHRRLLGQIFGVDINQFPAHLSVINLAIQNARARIDKVNVIVDDFFDIKAGQAILSGFEGVTAEGKRALIDVPAYFDVVVANPPYIRQELLGEGEKLKIKGLIEGEYRGRLFVGAAPKGVSDAIVLDKQSDIYIYFFIHGLGLLRNSGYLGFISSNKWLEVGYGEPFQRFLLDYAKIHYVIEFDRAVFPDAEVNTAVTILEKESDKRKRNENLVKFIRVKQKMDLESQIRLIQETAESFEDEHIRINVVKQGNLKQGKWNVYLRAPLVYQKIIQNPKVKPLENLAEVFFGIKTGYNDYFILSKEKAEKWGIEPQFLKPCVSSPKKVKGLVIHEEDVQEYFFMVNQPKNVLKGTNALKYIEYGERLEIEVTRGSKRGKRKLPQLETVRAREPWYALPQLKESTILFPRLIDIKPVFLRNDAQAHAAHVFYYIYPKNKQYTNILLGYLNSSVNALLVELYGRSYGGGVLELLVYEIEILPTLDPSSLSEDERSRIAKAFRIVVKAIDKRIKIEDELDAIKSRKEQRLLEDKIQRRLHAAVKEENEARRELDEAIYDTLGLTKAERIQVEKALAELQELRRLRSKT